LGALGFSCGIPLFLTSSTLAMWLKQVGISYTGVGVFGLVALPYTLKFVWSPFIDRMKIPWLTNKYGRRRSWLLLSQVFLIFSIIALSLLNPAENIALAAFFAVCVSFCSATQDVVMLAYQVERLGRSQYGAGEAVGIFGFRLGMITSGAGALYLSEYMSWNTVYFIMALVIGVGIITTLLIDEPEPKISPEDLLREKNAHKYFHENPNLSPRIANIFSWIYGAVICPFIDFTQRKGWYIALLIMFFYKIGDNLIGNMTGLFYSELGFSNKEIGFATKAFGIWSSVIGGFIGGIIVSQMSMLRSLFYLALIHGVATLMYVVMAHSGYDPLMLYTSVCIEHLTGGMRTTALFAYQLTICNSTYAATQLALLTSVVHLGRTTTSAFSGWFIDSFGWVHFFYICTFATTISLLLVVWLAKVERKQTIHYNMTPESM